MLAEEAAAMAGKGTVAAAASSKSVLKDTLTFDALFKRYELAKAFSLDSTQVRADAKRVKKRLQDANRLLLNPESRMMQTWDVVTVVALVLHTARRASPIAGAVACTLRVIHTDRSGLRSQ